MKRQTQEKIQALRELLLKQEQEAMRLALLENLLKAELTKNASDIDTDFADFLSQEIENCTERTVHPTRCRRTGTRRCMAIAVAALLVLCVAAGTIMPNQAGAFSLVRIMRFLTPLAQQFGITVNTDDGENVAVTKSETVYIETADSEWDTVDDCIFSDISDIPDNLDGYPTHPRVVPQGYTFKRADYYAIPSAKVLCMTYSNGVNEFFIQISTYTEDIGDSTILAESSSKVPMLNCIEASVNYGVSTVFMELDLGAYQIWGPLPTDDLIEIMKEYKGEIGR